MDAKLVAVKALSNLTFTFEGLKTCHQLPPPPPAAAGSDEADGFVSCKRSEIRRAVSLEAVSSPLLIRPSSAGVCLRSRAFSYKPATKIMDSANAPVPSGSALSARSVL